MTATMPSTLDTTRAFVEPALRAALARLDPWTHRVAAYHMGWSDEHGRPTTASRPATSSSMSAGRKLRPRRTCVMPSATPIRMASALC